MATVLACCLIINEIAFAPPEAAAEFVEILNLGSEAVSVDGLTLYDANSTPRQVSARPVPLEPGAYLVLARDAETFARVFPGVSFLEVPSWPSLNNGGDRVGIALDGVESDAVNYEASWGGVGSSLERVDPDGPSSHPINWSGSPNPTPGRRNVGFRPDREPPRLIFADRPRPDSVVVRFDEPVTTPGAEAFGAQAIHPMDDRTFLLSGLRGAEVSVRFVSDLFGNVQDLTTTAIAEPPTPGELIVSERLVRPRADPLDGLPDQSHFAELYNQGGRLVSLRGLIVAGPSDENGGALRVHTEKVFRHLQPGGTAILTESVAELSAAFAIGDSIPLIEMPADLLDEESLIMHTSQHHIDTARYHRSWHDPVLSESGRSLLRSGEDGRSPFAWQSADPSPGGHLAVPDRQPPRPGDIVITEVLFDARADGVEFVELHANRLAEANGLWLRIRRPPGQPDSVRLVYEPTPLDPGAFVVGVIPVSGIPIPDLAAYSAGRYPAAPPSTNWRPLVGARSLRDSGVAIQLLGPDRRLLDEVALTPDMHHPAIADVDGVSIHRRDPWGASDEPSNWSSTLDPSGATPGAGVGTREGTLRQVSFMEIRPTAFDPTSEHAALSMADPCRGSVSIRVFSRRGSRVRELTAALEGNATVYWDGTNTSGRPVAPGIYIVHAATSCGRMAKGVVVVARR